MQPIEVQAKTVQEAIALACRQLQTTEDNLGIEVLEQPPGKILSLFSGRKAKIRARLKQAPPPSAGAPAEGLQTIKAVLERIIREIDATARLELLQRNGETIFNIIGDGSGIFIGKKGQTLEAIQYLAGKIRMRQSPDTPHVIVDSEGYRSRHIKSLTDLALRLSEKAKNKGRPVATNPLSAADRRIVHMALKADEAVTTWSKGESGMRRVIIAPRQ